MCAVGAVIGLVNGLIIAYLNVTPFITTLGTMIIVYGINSLYYDSVGASPVAGFDPKFSTFAQGFLRFGDFKLSYITFYALIAIIFVWILWTKTRFGKNIFAIGGNPEAAKVSGVNVPLNLIMIYALSGVFYAFGGLLEAGASAAPPTTSVLCTSWTPSPPAWWAASRSPAVWVRCGAW